MKQWQKAISMVGKRRAINWTGICRILVLIALCLPASGVQAQTPLQARTDTHLLQLAATQPEKTVRVIVQKQTEDPAIEALIAQIGGRIVRSLPLIDGLVVELPAKAAPSLARAPGVRYVSLDAPMQLTSEPLTGDAMRTLLPLVMQSEQGAQSEQMVVSAAAPTTTVRDEFSTATFSNNNGSAQWAGNWLENDTEVGGVGPSVGQVQIVNGALRLDDSPDTYGQPSATRQVNLIGATSAAFSFDYRTTTGVDPDDAVTVEVSNNGGVSYTVLQTFTGITGISYGSRSLDITNFIAANTRIRFRVSNMYGASEEFFYVDNVQISYTVAGSAPSGPSNVGRYIRLVAQSEVNGNPWTAVAELNALDANGNVVPRTAWSVVSVDSQETVAEDGRGLNAIDGNPATYWHTQWSSANLAPPHQIVIDMGAIYTLSGFRYLTRQDNSDKGNIANYSFYMSQDGINWRAALSAGALLNTPTEQTVIFGKAPVANPVFTTWATTLGTVSATEMINAQNMVNTTGFGPDGLYGYHAGNSKGAFAGFEAELVPGYAIDKVQVVLHAYANSLFSENFTVKSYIGGIKMVDVKVTTDIFQKAIGAANARPLYIDITNIKSWTWADLANDLQIVIVSSGMSSSQTIYYDAIGLRVITKPGVDNSATTTAITTWPKEAIATSSMLNVFPFAVRAPEIWNEAPAYLQGHGMTIAVVDSGIAKTEDLKGRNVTTVNFNDGYHDGKDKYGHGTFVAAMLASDGRNSKGAYLGIAPRSQILNVRVSDDQGMAYESDVVEALRWISENKTKYNIRVVNLSLNSSVAMSYHQSPLNAAVEILWFNGIVVVVAAGNNGTAELFPPANDPFVITVGAVNDQGTQSIADDVMGSFSAYGTTIDGHVKPDLVAPGKDIVMSLPHNNKLVMGKQYTDNQIDNNYFRMSGTSMAAPIVAGAVALLLQDEPNLTPDQVKFRLMATARQDWGGYDPVRAGAGYLDIYAAVKGTTTASANTGIAASQLLWTGANPITWGSVSWNSVSWNSVSWNSVSWNSVSWNSVSWNSDYWGGDLIAAATSEEERAPVNSNESEENAERTLDNIVFLPIASR